MMMITRPQVLRCACTSTSVHQYTETKIINHDETKY